MDRIRVLLVDGDTTTREQLRVKIRDHINDLELVGEAQTGDDAMYIVANVAPDVVLLDVHLTDMDVLRVTRRLRQSYPTTSVVHLTRSPSEEELFGAIRYGAAAYIPKTIDSRALADVIERVHSGTYVIDDSVLDNPELASRVLTAFRELTAMNQQQEPLFVPLSPREREVLEHAAQGRSNREIARAMQISEQTVKNHLTSVMRKLAVNDRTHAVVYALQQGWITVKEM